MTYNRLSETLRELRLMQGFTEIQILDLERLEKRIERADDRNQAFYLLMQWSRTVMRSQNLLPHPKS